MSWRIDTSLERSHTDATERIDETFALFALGNIDIENAFECRGHFGFCNRGSDDTAERSQISVSDTAQGNLIPLFAVLIDAEDADVADMMMTAGIHAARHFEFDISEIVEIIEIVEPFIDLLCDG